MTLEHSLYIKDELKKITGLSLHFIYKNKYLIKSLHIISYYLIKS